ncbi:hypothetical protein GXW71_10330 [Roseomonas hellenica]|uniref:Uncharacterized protein n=1 Tax=Plastoroseomonas hellenica TaxID=2687306 RepID=A0ABS5EWR8_9PROT|nr:hypothetical protein [Plastoroseomonas hellenica]MBR0664747.1 hypothetical protein [Plastoroseomonas hellenica]
MREKVKAGLASSRFLVQLAASLHWVWAVPLRPFRRAGAWMVGSVFRWYRLLWVRCTHNEYGGFVYWRGGAMILATGVALYLIPVVLGFVAQTALYFTTRNYEEVYLIQSEEIYPDDNVWAVRGCDRLPCDRDSSIYFRISPTPFNHLWSVVNTGWLFVPDDVGSGVPTGLTRCWVRSYGIRIKTLMRRFEIYPDALDISCRNAVER